MWLLVATLMQIYNEKDQTEQRKMQNVQFEEKRSTRKYNGIKPRAPRKFTEKSDAKWSKESSDLRSVPTQLSFQLVRRNTFECFVIREWNYLEGLGGMALLEEVCHWGGL